VSGSLRQKTLSLCIKSAAAPDDAQLTAIRQFTLVDVPAENLYVRTFIVAHNGIDRDRECFDEALLADFARTLPGKGLFIKHPTSWDGDSGPGKGRWFAAKLEQMALDEARTLLREPGLKFPPGVDTAVLLLADMYMTRTATNADLQTDIDAGIVGDVSVGFNAKDCERLVDAAGNEMNAWRLMGPGEALEASLVWLGAQPGARAIKGAKQSPENDDVTLQEMYDAAKAELERTKSALAAAQPSHEIVLKAREALGSDGALIDSPALLADAVKAGKAHRETLVEQIILGERHAGLLGDDPESVAAAKAIHMGDSLERLDARAKHYAAKAPAGSKLKPSDPNAPKDDATDHTKSAPAVFAAAPLI
jgi:hypothetical protein